jgi:hypothetical protein
MPDIKSVDSARKKVNDNVNKSDSAHSLI